MSTVALFRRQRDLSPPPVIDEALIDDVEETAKELAVKAESLQDMVKKLRSQVNAAKLSSEQYPAGDPSDPRR